MDISSIVNGAASSEKNNPIQNGGSNDALLDAIDSATLKRVQTVLREVCLECPEALNLASKKLLVSPTEAPGTKRKHDSTQRYEICVQCNEEYDTKDNQEDSCVWHSGETEVDDEGDFWADHDEDCHGVIEDLRDVYPEGFVWSCCEKKGDEEGCEISRHEPDLSKRVRRG